MTGHWAADDGTSPNGTDPFLRYDLAATIRQPGKRPAVLEHLVYAGKIHSIAGPPEAGKTLIVLHLLLEAMRLGRPTMLIDHETGPEQTTDLLRDMGADPDMLAKLLVYVPYPDTGWGAGDIAHMQAVIASHQPVIVAFDSLGEMLGAAGLDENKPADVTRLANAVFMPIVRWHPPGDAPSPGVIFTDHDTKSAEGSASRYATGTGAKLRKVDVQVKVSALATFSRDNDGRLALMVSKDRVGCLWRHWEIEVTRDPLRLEFTKAKRPAARASGGLGPAEEKLHAALTPEPVRTSQLMDRFVDLHGHGLRRETVSRGLATLLDLGMADKITEGRDALWSLPSIAAAVDPAPAADSGQGALNV